MHISQRLPSLGHKLKSINLFLGKTASQRDEDLQAWQQWNITRDGLDLQKLMKRMEGIIISNVSKWRVRVPRSSLRAEAERLSFRAFETYNPNNFGHASLATHVSIWLRKLHSFASRYGDIGKRPEDRFSGARRFNEGESHLKTQLKRDPTAAEVADFLKIPVREVGRYRLEQIQSLTERNPTELSSIKAIDPTKRYAIEAVYYDLGPEEKLVYEYLLGRGGRIKTESTGEIARLTGMTASKVSRLKKKIAKKLEVFL